MPTLVDTHTHLQLKAFDGDRDEVVERAAAHGVAKVVVIGIDLPTSRAAAELADERPGQVYASVGIHPNSSTALDDAALDELRELAGRPGVVAIGEIGLDFHHDRCPRETQRAAFRRQQQLALELGMPIVIHSRAALEAVQEELERGGGFGTRVVMHCLTTDPEWADGFLERGCWIGMDGPVTFPKASDAHAIARRVPLDKLLLETDCPFLAPQADRGKRCEPWHVRLVAEEVARLRGLALEEVCKATSANAAAFFRWETS